MKTLMTALSLAALVGASVPAFAVTPGTFDPRDPNSLSKSGQTAQTPYALTGSARGAHKQNDSRVEVNSSLGARAVITTHDGDKK